MAQLTIALTLPPRDFGVLKRCVQASPRHSIFLALAIITGAWPGQALSVHRHILCPGVGEELAGVTVMRLFMHWYVVRQLGVRLR